MSNVLREYEKIVNAKSVVEVYDLRMKAYDNLSESEGNRLCDLLYRNRDKIPTTTTVHMGLNTTKGDNSWEDLLNEIRTIVERDGICFASWSCSGRTRHYWQSQVLEQEMPEYQFDIEYESYKCEIRKRV